MGQYLMNDGLTRFSYLKIFVVHLETIGMTEYLFLIHEITIITSIQQFR